MDEKKVYNKPPLKTSQLLGQSPDTHTETVTHVYGSNHSKSAENGSDGNYSNTKDYLHKLYTQSYRIYGDNSYSKKSYTNPYATGSKYQLFGNEHPLTNILNAIGIAVYICGFMGGIILGSIAAEELDGSPYSTIFISWISAFISGTLFLAAGEVINLLQKILDKKDTQVIREAPDNFDTSVNRLKELQNLLDAGAITKEEFDIEKNKIMELINKICKE